MSPEEKAITDPHDRIDTHVTNDVKRWWALIWAFCVMGLVLAILSGSFLYLLGKANTNTRHAQAAICFEIAYLDNAAKQPIVHLPGAGSELTRLQLRQKALTARLNSLLKQQVPNCHEFDFNQAVKKAGTPAS
jgi:hypothetical protein